MAKKRKMARKSITGSWKRFGIQNNVGGIWTPTTFDSKEKGENYLDFHRRVWPHPGGLRRHKVVPVRVTVTACG